MLNKRRIEISLLNVLFCLTVIFIHIISYAVTAFEKNTIEYNLVMIPWSLATFVVQGFVMLSGLKLFLNGKDTLPFLKYIKLRVLGIIVPYAICFAVYYIYFVITSSYPLDFSFMLKHFLLGSLVFHLYFIPIIFQFDLLFPLWKRIVNKCSPALIIPFAVFISMLCREYLPQMLTSFFPNINFIYNDRLFTTYLVFWLLGCYIGKYYDAFLDILKRNFRTILYIFIFVLVLTASLSYFTYNNIVYVPCFNIVHMLYEIYTCIFLYALALKIPQGTYEKIPLIAKIDKASFYIYLYHVLIIFFMEKLFRFII